MLSKVLTLERGHLFMPFGVLGFKGTILKLCVECLSILLLVHMWTRNSQYDWQNFDWKKLP
jgi:hypothetical protein